MPDDCPQSLPVLAIRIAELEKRFQLHVDYQRVAVEKASFELRERLAAMNEFREQLKDQAATFLKRDDVMGRVEKLEQINAYGEGKMWAVGVLATLAGGAIGSLVGYLLK